MEKKFVIYLIIFLFDLILSDDEVISFKIESFQDKRDSSNYNIINELQKSYLTTIINIGSNSYPLKTFITSTKHYFYISDTCYIDKSTYPDYKTNFNYNRHNSFSFHNTTPFDLTFSGNSHSCIANEDFELFLTNKKETKKEKINFILAKDTTEDDPNCLYLGLLENMNKESTFHEYNLITQLKQKSFIKENCWCIIFNKPNNYDNDHQLINSNELLNLKGDLYIGDYPHNFDSSNFFESQLVRTYTTFQNNIMKWELKFNKIFYKHNSKEIKILTDNSIALDPSSFLTVVSKDYIDSIDEHFFKKYSDVCHYIDIDEEYSSIYCEKSEKFSINEIKTFPPLFFEHIDLEYTFELTFKDLFVEKDGKYWVLLLYDDRLNPDQWVLGNMFLRKYQFVFNLESKEIKFYNPSLEIILPDDEHENGSIFKTILYIALIVVLCIMLVGGAYLIKTRCFPSGKKKKRANELDDDFEYESHKNETDNNKEDNKLFADGNNQD